MTDFYQSGVITTLHRLGEHRLDTVEQQLERYAQEQPIALVLPALYCSLLLLSSTSWQLALWRCACALKQAASVSESPWLL